MTLDIPKFIKKTIEKQMTIQHYDALVKVFRKEALPTNIIQKIQQQFGDTYLEDSNFIVFYKGRINKKGLKKLFNITDKALGEDANRLTEGDFKIFKLNDSDDTSEFQNTNADDNSNQDDGEADTTNDEQPSTSDSDGADDSSFTQDSQDIADISSSNSSSSTDDEDDSKQIDDEVANEVSSNNDTDDQSDDDDSSDDVDDDIAAVDDEEQLDKEISAEVNKPDDSSEKEINEDDDVDESIPVRFFFLKITIKH